MAVATTQFVISPDDGWVEIASNPASLIIKADEASSWRLAVTTGASPAAGSQATGHVDFTGVPANNGTVTIAGVVYTFKTALTPAANEVFRGVDATAMATNLAAAINAGAGAGTLYGTGTVANPYVFASSALGVVTITAKTPGVDGNSLALVDGATNMTVSGATLTTGVDYVAGILYGANRGNLPVELGGFTGKAWVRTETLESHIQVMKDVGGGSGGSVSITGTVETTPAITDATSASGTITLGGTAQEFMAANAARKGWAIENQSADYIYVRSRGAGGVTNATQDQDSVRIAPGQMYIPPYTSVNAQSVIGPTTGQAFWAREW